jgi:SAM-dependent methyltransferase
MKLMDLRSKIKACAPREIIPLIVFFRRTYLRLLCLWVGLWDRRNIRKSGFDRLPPASLRYRVHGSPDLGSFLDVGKKCVQDIEASLSRIGKNLGVFQNILDFGCGCGRTLLWLGKDGRASSVYGTDIDPEAVLWCTKHLGFGKFSVNKALPPLDFPSGVFDLILAVSVFTHLDEDHQFLWLRELQRVTNTKGILVLTVHGHYCWKELRSDDMEKVRAKGFLFLKSNFWKGLFPEWYQTAYHTQEYVLKNYGKYFKVLDYIPRGLNNHQDVVILQKS